MATTESTAAPPPGNPPALDPAAMIRSRAYLSALVLATILGIPISAIAYGFLALVTKIQDYLFTDLPGDVFDGGTPAWWPIPFLVLCGLLTGATIRYLPGNGGHSPAFGFVTGGGPPVDRELPAIDPRVAHHPGAGRRPRPRGPAHRHRRWPRGAGRAPAPEGRPADGRDDHGVGRQLRRDQHAAGVAAHRRVPDHGGRRGRGRDPQPGGAAGTARGRCRRDRVHRPRQLDRSR